MGPFSDQDFVALGRMMLYGEIPSQELLTALLEHMEGPESPQRRVLQAGGAATWLALVLPLSLGYRMKEELRTGRCDMESPAAEAARQMDKMLWDILSPRLARSLIIGDATAFSHLAEIIGAARALTVSPPALGDLVQVEQWLGGLMRRLTGKRQKFSKKTRRIRALLPLWLWGFGRYAYAQQVRIFEQIGLSEDEIPEADALRKLLSYHRISSRPHPRR